MHRLTALVFVLLVLVVSVVPSALARETNADRLKRGYPPLPPTRRETAKRQQSSPILGTGVIEVRDPDGTTLLGFVENSIPQPYLFSVIDPSEPTADRLQAQFSSSGGTLIATNLVFIPPFTPLFDAPFYLSCLIAVEFVPPFEAPLIINQTSDGVYWSYNLQTQELTIQVSSGDDSTAGSFAWKQAVNRVQIWSSSHAPVLVGMVRLFLVPAT